MENGSWEYEVVDQRRVFPVYRWSEQVVITGFSGAALRKSSQMEGPFHRHRVLLPLK